MSNMPTASVGTTQPIVMTEAQLRGRAGKKWQAYGAQALPTWVADMDFRPPEVVVQALAATVTSGDFCYPSTSLEPDVKASYRARMREQHGWDPGPDRVVLLADLVQGLTATILAYSAVGESVVTLTPAYPPLLTAIGNCGRVAIETPLVAAATGYAIDFAVLEKAFARPETSLLLLCSPHNPTGRVFTAAELDEIAVLARRHSVTVVSDEIHSDLVFPGHRFIPYADRARHPDDQVVTLQSASKAFNLGGLRCGLVHFGSDGLERAFNAVHPDRLLGRVNRLGMTATVVAWNEGQSWLDQVLALLLANRDRLTSWADQHPLIQTHVSQGTYFGWLDCALLPTGDRSPWEFLCQEAGVVPSDGREFGEAGTDFVRLNFATSPKLLDQILARIDAATLTRPRLDLTKPHQTEESTP